MQRNYYFAALLMFSIFIFSTVHASDNQIKKSNTPHRTARASSNQNSTKLNLNNISTWIHNNGGSDNSLLEQAGMEFPRGSAKKVVYKSGLVWGAKLNGNIHVGGSTYRHGLKRGKILNDGSAEDTNLVTTRIYRVRPDYKTADFTIEASEEMKTQQEIFRQYESDWNEWPAADGAPYNDINGDGKYDPDKDIPGVKNAIQTVWYAANDLDSAQSKWLYGSLPMGIEMQATFWTYDRDFVLKNTYFRKYRIINKSKETFGDMYVSLWSDPDVGSWGDDLAGCDTTLNLGFAYNGNAYDGNYSPQAPPAIGFDLLQGPVVKGTAGKDLNRNGIEDSQDTAFVNGKKSLKGYINLPMTAFYSFNMLSPELTDPALGSYEGTTQMYNFMQGKIGKTGNYFLEPGGKYSTYMYTGDPGAGKGWLDGVSLAAGDRRTGIAAGPFNMTPGDTQEVTFAQIAALGANNLNSVYLLKQYDQKVKQYYNNSFYFDTIPAPQAPDVKAHYTKDGIYIDWQADTLIEKYSKDGFNFEGYNLYQLNNGIPDKKNGIKLAVFDLVNGIKYIYGRETDSLFMELIKIQQHGMDRGIQRSFAALRDSIGKFPFIIGKKYFFGVSAYTYRQDPEGRFNNSESPLSVVSVVFQDSLPGPKYMDTLKVFRIGGQSDKMITAVVYDPSKITGHEYEVGFEKHPGGLSCYLKDVTLDKYVTRNIYETETLNPFTGDRVLDGIKFGIYDAAPGMKDYKVISGTRKWTWINSNGFFMEGFNGAIGYPGFYWYSGSIVQAEDITNTLIKFAATDSLGNILDTNDPNASYAYRYLRLAQNPAARPEFQQHIKNTSGSFAYQDYTKSLPFAAYNESGERLMVGYTENNVTGGRVNGKYWPPSGEEGIDNYSVSGPREWFFIFNVPYSEIPSDALCRNAMQTSFPMMWFGTPNRTGPSNTVFSSSDQLLIIKNNLFTDMDKFGFKTGNTTSVKTGIIPFRFELNQNYPNPFNPGTSIRFSLAERGTVSLKVFNILGQLVRVLADGEFNAGIHKLEFRGDNLASGIYIYRLDVKNKFTDVKKMIFLK